MRAGIGRESLHRANGTRHSSQQQSVSRWWRRTLSSMQCGQMVTPISHCAGDDYDADYYDEWIPLLLHLLHLHLLMAIARLVIVIDIDDDHHQHLVGDDVLGEVEVVVVAVVMAQALLHLQLLAVAVTVVRHSQDKSNAHTDHSDHQ